MKQKSLFAGMLAAALAFGLMVAGCDDPTKGVAAPPPDTRVTLSPGLPPPLVLASETTASVSFYSATAGLTLSAADFAVDNGASVTSASVVTYNPPYANPSSYVVVNVAFAPNDSTTSTKTYTVSIAADSTKIKGDATVAINQGEAGKELGGTVSISGTAEVRQTLTAVTTGLTGQSGTLYYEWRAGEEAVYSYDVTYIPTAADVGKTITVTVTASGSTGSVTSEPTAAVAAPEPGVTVDGLGAYLAGLTAGSPSSPHTVSMDWSIVIDTSSYYSGVWATINNTVKNRGVYVILDLSACIATNNTVIGEDSTNPSGNHMNIICNNSYIKGIILPNTLTSIGDCAFSFCTSLESVTIPSSVASIGKWAFSFCSSLESVTIPSSVASIGEGAFSGCSNLTSVTIPAGVTTIGKDAFANCTSLASVTIPDSVASIGEAAFFSCRSLASITIPNSVTTIGKEVFSGCGLTSVTIPGSVVNIGESAFWLCTRLASVTIQNGVTTIGDNAFTSCNSLASITIPNSVTTIGKEAFSGCTGLASITIPGSVASIGEAAFSGCTRLASVTIQNGVTSIGKEVFSGCTSLASITIPGSVTSIATGVENSSFSGCTSLASITVDAANTAFSSEGGVLFNKAKTTLLFYPQGHGASYTIPSSVTSIRTYAFYDCTSLASVTIPGSVTSIEERAFYNTGLTSVTFGTGSNIASGNFGSYAFPPIYNDALKTLYLDQSTKAGTYSRASTSASAWTKD